MNKDAVAERSQQYQVEAAEKLVPEGYKQTEVGIIPEDWKVVEFGAVVEKIVGGGTPSRSNPAYWGNDIPWVTVKDFATFTPFTAQERITKLGLQNSSSNLIPSGTLITSTRMALGKAVIYKVDVAINQDLKAIFTNRNLEASFLYFWFESNAKKIEGLGSGSTVKGLSLTDLRKIPFLLQSVEEQVAIVNVLSDVDALLSELEKLIAKKQAIKTAIMQQLLTGRTRLPQFANHPDGSKKGYKQSELGEIPEDWATRTYGEIFSFLTTSTNSRSDLSDNGEYGYIHYGDIHTLWSNFLDLDKRTTPKIEPVLVRSAFIQDGDLVMADASEDYEGIGKSIEIKNIGNKLIVAGLHTYLLRDSHSFFVDGFRGYLHEIPAVKSMIDKLATGMKVYGISKGNLEGIYLLIPSKEEQTAIATILSDMDEEIQALEQRLNKTRQIKQGMMQELLTGKIRLVKPTK